MSFRLITVCLYLTFAYWMSSHIAVHNVLFYPTLGAFSYFFITKRMRKLEFLKVICAAVIGVTCGSALHVVSSGGLSFLLTCLLILFMLHLLKLHAAPVVGVSLIPFFSKTSSFWVLPVSVLISLLGLFLVLWCAQLAEEKWSMIKRRIYVSS